MMMAMMMVMMKMITIMITAEEKCDDAVVGDNETCVLFFPWPAGDRDRKEVGAENA